MPVLQCRGLGSSALCSLQNLLAFVSRQKFLSSGLETAFLRQICAVLDRQLRSQPETIRHRQLRELFHSM